MNHFGQDALCLCDRTWLTLPQPPPLPKCMLFDLATGCQKN